MLTIENITKVWKMDVCGWRIGKIETTNNAYLFQLYKLNRRERMQVNLERNDINGEYELWHWKPANITANSTPNRLLFNKKTFETPNKFLNALNLLIM